MSGVQLPFRGVIGYPGRMGCVDKEALDLVARVARSLDGLCQSAVVLLTTKCPEESHGTHVSAAVATASRMAPSEARALCRKLREVAYEIEQRYAPAGSEN